MDLDASQRLNVVYRVRNGSETIEERARQIAVEQSVEMPVSAIEDEYVRSEIIGQVFDIRSVGDGRFDVEIELSAATVGEDPGQLLNMLFGNTSLHEDVTLQDFSLPDNLLAVFRGPRHGLDGLRKRAKVEARAMTCSALKPQGLPPAELAELAARFAAGGIDFIKDDHGLADQAYSPFKARVEAVTKALKGSRTRYAPSLSGDLDKMRDELRFAVDAGIDTAMVAPMVSGVANFNRIVQEFQDVAFLAHPAMGGAARIHPPLLIGKLFRILGADGVIFPNHGGRFGYSAQICGELAAAASGGIGAIRPAAPVPAGGMTLDRAPEILDFYGPDIILLIGGGLLAERNRLTEATSVLSAIVHDHLYDQERRYRPRAPSPKGA